MSERLEAELIALGRTLTVAEPPEDLVVQVLARIGPGEARRGLAARPWAARWKGAISARWKGAMDARWRGAMDARWRRLVASRRRLVAVIVAALIVGLALTPPVRAAVVEWLGIGGVLVRTAPATDGRTLAPEPAPTAGQVVTLEEARRLVAFPVVVPAALGAPDRVSVSQDHRIVAMDWGNGPGRLHLDQFDGELSWVFVKQARVPIQFVDVGGRDAVWFATAHEIVYVDAAGVEHAAQARVSGPSLVWVRPGGRQVTLRLEGEQSIPQAVAIAESAR